MTQTTIPLQDSRELTVLFVGTPPVDLQTLCSDSCAWPIGIDVVDDGRAAIQRLTETSESSGSRMRPDLIVLQCDFELPDGMTVLHAIKSSPRLSTVPAVVLGPNAEGLQTAYETGGNAYVETPRTAVQYVEVIRSIIQFWFEWAQYPAQSLYSDT